MAKHWQLIIIFLLAIYLRFLFFPNDISFTYDQARDAYISQELISGDFKIVGPPSTFSGVSHGPLYYYLIGPLYKIFQANPEAISVLMRIYNALGIILVFLITKILFNKNTGLIAALLFALSFEQTQFSIFLGHPSLAIITVLLFYYGLARFIIEKKSTGLVIALLGLGLSIQFHFSLIILFLPLVLNIIFYSHRFLTTNRKTHEAALIVFLLTISSYLIAEFKFNFPITKAFSGFFVNSNSAGLNFYNVQIVIIRYLSHNLYSQFYIFQILILLIFLVFLFVHPKYKNQAIFIMIWLFSGLFVYLFDHSNLPAYHYSIGTSVSFLILAAFILGNIIQNKLFIFITILFIGSSNLALIKTNNPKGNLPEIIVQDEMLLHHQKEAINFIYNKAASDEFSIGSLSNPYLVNTTWSYLFENYAYPKYHYLPVWLGDYASGFPGNMKIEPNRANGTAKHFIIIEPSRGIEQGLFKRFLQNEDIFSKVIKEQNFGQIIIQERQKI